MVSEFMVEHGSGEMRIRSVLLPSDNSGTPYILMPVNRRKWEQQHGNLPKRADTHVNSHVYFSYLAEGRLCDVISIEPPLE